MSGPIPGHLPGPGGRADVAVVPQVSLSAALPRPSEASAAPKSNPLDWPLAELAGRVQYPCSDRACRDRQRLGLTDNARVRCRIVIREVGGEVVERPHLSSARHVFEHNIRLKNGSVQLQLDVCCGMCGALATTILPNDTAERLYLAFRELVTHDKSLPLLYFPGSPKKNQRIPEDAQAVCAMAHEFDAKLITHRMIKRISASLRAGALRTKLDAKMRSSKSGPRFTYLRIGVGIDRLGEITPILELWPVGHQSPKHQHGGCAGSVRVLHGKLNMRLYDSLCDPRPMKFVTGDGGLDLPPGEHAELLLKEGDTTWLNRANWFVHEVSCLKKHRENADGFALSLHVYKSCTDEFEFVNGWQAEKKNPENDFFWNVDLPEDDKRLTDERAPPDFADALAAPAAAEASPSVAPSPPSQGRAREQAEGSRRDASAAGLGRPREPEAPFEFFEDAVLVPGHAHEANDPSQVEILQATSTTAGRGRHANPDAPANYVESAFLQSDHEDEVQMVQQGGGAAGHGRPTQPGSPPDALEAEAARPAAGAAADGDRRRHAADNVLDLGGAAELTDSDLERLLGALGGGLHAAKLHACRRLTDSSVRELAMRNLGLLMVDLAGCELLTDAAAGHLAESCTHLQAVSFRSCELVTDVAAQQLSRGCRELRDVDFGSCRGMTDAAAGHLAEGCPHLRRVGFSGCQQLGDTAVTHLASGCPDLWEVDVAACRGVTDAAAEHLAAGCPHLQRVCFRACPRISDTAAWHLARGCRDLREVDFGYCRRLTDVAAEYLAAGCPQLRKVSFMGCPQLTDAAAQHLARGCRELGEVGFAGCRRMSSVAAIHLAGGCPKLQRVHGLPQGTAVCSPGSCIWSWWWR